MNGIGDLPVIDWIPDVERGISPSWRIDGTMGDCPVCGERHTEYAHTYRATKALRAPTTNPLILSEGIVVFKPCGCRARRTARSSAHEDDFSGDPVAGEGNTRTDPYITPP